MMQRSLALLLVVTTATPVLAQPAPPPPQPQPSPYAAPAPYPYPYPYPPPPPGYPPAAYPAPYAAPVEPAPPPTGDVELVADFAALGVLGAFTLIDARDLGDQGSGTLLMMAGAAAGGATGYLLGDSLHPSRADGHATTMGMSLGLLNSALLLVPLGLDDSSEEIMPTLLVGGTVGAVGGLALGRGRRLTSGQSMFATNLALLGLGTSALAGALIDGDGELDRGEMTTLVVGLDAGAVAGMLLAPKITWSHRRARTVGMASLAGFFAGSLIGAGFTEKRADGSRGDPDPDAMAIGVLAGMWGGFLAGVKLTDGYAPDPRFAGGAAPVTVAPLVGQGQTGVSIQGGF